MKNRKGRPGKRILCINDGNVFNSLLEAASYYNIAQASLSRQIKGERRTVGGYHFIKIGIDVSDEDIRKLREDALKQIYNIESK